MDAEYILKKKENFEELFNKVENRKNELYKKIEKLERIVRNMIAVPVLLNAIIMPIVGKIFGLTSIVSSLIAATPLIVVEVGILLLIEIKIDNKKIPAIKEEIETTERELDALYELKGLFKQLEILNQEEMTSEKARIITGKENERSKYFTSTEENELLDRLLNYQTGYKGSTQLVKKMNLEKEDKKL